MSSDTAIYDDVPEVIPGDEATTQSDAVPLIEPNERIYQALPAETEIRVQSAPWLYAEKVRSYALELLDRPETDILYSFRVVCNDAPDKNEPSVTPDMSIPPEFWAGMRNCNQLLITGATAGFAAERKSPEAYRDRAALSLATIAETLLTSKNAAHLPPDFEMLSDKPEHVRLINSARFSLNKQTYAEQISKFIAQLCSIDPTEKQWLQFVGNTPESLAELTEVLKTMVITRFAEVDPAKNFLVDWPDQQYLVCGTLLYYRRMVGDNPAAPEFAFEPYGMMIQVMASHRMLRFDLAQPVQRSEDEPSA